MKSKAKHYTFQGPIRWAKVFDENKETHDWQGQAHAFGGLFKVDMILDNEQRKTLKESGSAIKGSIDSAGNFIATFKRKEVGPFVEAGGAPKVMKADGTPWNYDEDGTIGNDSIAQVTFEVYPTKMAPGTRLMHVKVIEHKPYVRPKEIEEDAA